MTSGKSARQEGRPGLLSVVGAGVAGSLWPFTGDLWDLELLISLQPNLVIARELMTELGCLLFLSGAGTFGQVWMSPEQ